MKKKILGLIFLIILISAGFYVNNRKEKVTNELTLYGNIEIRQVDLGFQVKGKLQKLLKEEGDSVEKGELVALLDDKDYKADLEKSTAEVERLKAKSDDAQSQYQRQHPLCADNTISKQDCDTLTNTKNETKAAYESAIAEKQFAKNQYDYAKLFAPNKGIITTRVQEEGAVVNASAPVYTISLTEPVWIRAYISEKHLGNIKYDMKATVLTDSVDPKTGKQRTYEGRIGYISPVAEFTPKTVQTTDLRTDLVYRIRVYVDKTDPFLRQGMPTTVKINLIQNSNPTK